MNRFIRKLHPEFPLHVTGRCNNREPFPIPIDDVWKLFSDYLCLISQEYEIKIHSFVLMPNHYHLICQDPKMNLSDAMQFFMRRTSLEMGRASGRINRIWGAPFFSSVISNDIYYQHAYKYTYRNPVAACLSPQPEEYAFSTLQILLGLRKGHIPLECDSLLFENLEQSLKWLNTPYKESEVAALKNAFNKKVFKVVRQKHNSQMPSFLRRDLARLREDVLCGGPQNVTR